MARACMSGCRLDAFWKDYSSGRGAHVIQHGRALIAQLFQLSLCSSRLRVRALALALALRQLIVRALDLRLERLRLFGLARASTACALTVRLAPA